MKDRKIKKSINKELAPEISFSEFCSRAGIELPEKRREAEKPRTRLPKRRVGRLTGSICAASAVCAAIAAAFLIPFFTKIDAGVGIAYAYVSPAEVKRSGIMLFNERYVDDCPDFCRYYVENDKDSSLAYRVNDVEYGAGTDSFYKFDYLVRLSETFEFEEQDIEVQFAFTKNEVRYEYTLNCNRGGKIVTQIKFTKGDAEYFVFLHEYNGSTGLDIAGVQNFIEMAFMPVTPQNPWDDFFGS